MSSSTMSGVEVTGNRRLFVGGIPRQRHREEIFREMSRQVSGVVDVILYPSAQDKTKNRGFAFVEFRSAEEAGLARAAMSHQQGRLWGAPVCVDWAEPEPEVDQALMATVRVLYVRNLMLHTAEDTIRAHFDALHPGTVERVKKLKDFAFVHYTQRRFALDNLRALNGSSIDGAVLEVQLAKPTDKAAQLRHRPNVPQPLPLLPPFTGPRPLMDTRRHHLPQLLQPMQQYPVWSNGDPHSPLHLPVHFPGQPKPGPPRHQAQPPIGRPHSSLEMQKHRVELLAMQSQMEMEKLRLMEKERALSEVWQAMEAPAYSPVGQHVDTPALPLTPLHSARTPQQAFFDQRPWDPPFNARFGPVGGAKAAGKRASWGWDGLGVLAEESAEHLLTPTLPRKSPVEEEARPNSEDPASNGSSPGFSSVSSGPATSAPSFGQLSALGGQTSLHPLLSSSVEDLAVGPVAQPRRLSGGQDLRLPLGPTTAPHTPLYSRCFAASSPKPRTKPHNPASVNAADSGLGQDSQSLSLH